MTVVLETNRFSFLTTRNNSLFITQGRLTFIIIVVFHIYPIMILSTNLSCGGHPPQQNNTTPIDNNNNAGGGPAPRRQNENENTTTMSPSSCLPIKVVLLNIFQGEDEPILPPPPLPPPLVQRWIGYTRRYLLLPIVAFPILLLKIIQIGWKEVWDRFQVVWKIGRDDSIKDYHEEYYQNPKLLQQLYSTQKSAQVYIDHDAFEWQIIDDDDGYSGSATLRCILASFGIPLESLPPQKRHPKMGPEQFIQQLEDTMRLLQQPSMTTTTTSSSSSSTSSSRTREDKSTIPNEIAIPSTSISNIINIINNKNNTSNSSSSSNINNIVKQHSHHHHHPHHPHLPKITSEIIPGDCSYEIFLQTIRRVVHNKEQQQRLVINFFRPALFGPPQPLFLMWLPNHLLSGLFGGNHFSPIIGIIEQEGNDDDTTNPLVAIFDVDYNYGGTYFVPARRLYQSLQVPKEDSKLGGKRRALIVITKN